MNFSGMMRGLGAGIVNVGQMMQEQNKLDWETQQANLKYERDQHMAALAMKNQNAQNQANRDLTVSEAALTRTAGKEQWQASDARQKEQNENTRAHQEKVEANQELQIRNQGSESAAQAAYRAKSLENQGADSAADAAYRDAMLNKDSDAMKIHKEEKAALERAAKELYKDDLVKQDIYVTAKLYGKGADGKPLTEAAIEAGQAQTEAFKAQNDGKDYKQAYSLFKEQHPKSSKLEFDSQLVVHSAEIISGRNTTGQGAATALSQSAPKATVDSKDIEALIVKGETGIKRDFGPARAELLKLSTVKSAEGQAEYKRLSSLLAEAESGKVDSYKPKAQSSMLGGGSGFTQ